MKKGVLALFLFIFVVSLGSAETQTLGGIDGFPPGQDIILTQTCTNCTFVNITYVMLASDQSEKINSEMTKDGTFYNLTLTSDLTTALGEYVVNWLADPDGITTSGNYYFHVRNNGALLTTAESVLYIFVALFNFLATIFFLYYGITLPYTDDRTKDGTLTRIIPFKYLKLLSVWIGYGALVWLLSIISAIVNNFVSLEATRTLMTNLYIFMYILAYPLSIVIMSILMIEAYRDMFVPMLEKMFMGITKMRRVN